MTYEESGHLVTDSRTVGVSETWETQSDWEAYQERQNVVIENGTVKLAEAGVPNADLLQARYDARELTLSEDDSVSTWTDETENDHHLTAGTAATYKTGVINGNPVVRFDGVDDYLDVGWGETLTQANYIFVVAQKRSAGTNNFETLFDSIDSNDRHVLNSTSDNEWLLGTSEANISGGSDDTNPHIFGGVFDNTNSELRIDGAIVLSGDVGGDDSTDFRVGANSGDPDNFGDYDVGEILFYHSEPNVSDVEDYLSNGWGITI